jgi:diguanylate cyclase (GGDEF)-like protein/PAS domain S-box-containing protein
MKLPERMDRWRPGLRAAVVSVCGVLILATAVAVSVSVSDHVRKTAVNEAVKTAQTVVHGYVDPMFVDGKLQASDLETSVINEQLARVVDGGGYLRIKVWAPDGTIVYSDLPALRGRQFEVEEDLQEALDGETAADFSDGSADENEFERGVATHLLETYLPIRGANDDVIGAYEVYQDAAPIDAEIAATSRDVMLIVGAIGLLLLLLLFGAFSGASKLLSRQNRRLRTSEQRFRSLVQNSADVQMVVTPDGTISYESNAVERVLGFEADSRTGQSLLAMTYRDDRARVGELLTDVARTPDGLVSGEVRMRHADSSWRWVEMLARNLLADPAVAGIVVNYRDVTGRRMLEDELRHQAFHDSLTGLPNRALFLDRLSHGLARRRRFRGPLAVLFVDLDDFKTVNDSLGHAAGDDLLKAVAARLAEALRSGDTIARMGGDEFAVLVEDANGRDAPERVAQRLLAALQAPFSVNDSDLFVRASVGLTVSTTRNDSAEEMLRNADTAMYTAKANGKNRIERFETSMHDAALNRLALKVDLERAVERGEFFVEYQPIVDLAGNELPGLEALVRWRHPRRGVVGPSEFIPVAEETGLIVPLGHWVLETACRQLRAWDESTGRQAAVSVNVSARQVQRPDFAANVAAVVKASGVDPRRITLEFTESTLMHDTEATVETLRRLKEAGLRLAIDDFGTGYSSLNYLRRFPIDELKIDRSFIAQMAREPAQMAVVRSIIRLAETLKLRTVAEGIEDETQLHNLRQLGAGYGQGFFFGAALPPDQVEELLKAPRSAGREVA